MKKIPTAVLIASVSIAIAAHEFTDRNATGTPADHQLAWLVQTSGVDSDLRGVSAVDAKTCWASGSNGTVLRTMDAGKTWRSIKVPGAEKMNFRDIEAFDQDTALVMSIGRPAKIFKTSDGGASWAEVYDNNAEGIFLDAVAFTDKNTGFAVGDPMDGRFFIIGTEDGGKTWRQTPIEGMPAAAAGEGAFAASGTCLAGLGKRNVWFCTGGPVSRVFRSFDGGASWQAADSALCAGTATSGGFSLVFLNDKDGVMVGGDYKNESGTAHNAAVSGDGGKTWEPIETRQPSGFRECVAAVPGTKPPLLVTVGLNGSDYSLDCGRTWTAIAQASGFHSVSFSKDGAGWAVGKKGLIAKFATT